jgi:hypothetical protein
VWNVQTEMTPVELIVDTVRRRPGSSFVELQKALEPVIPTRGEYSWEAMPNLVLWIGMSKEFVDAMTDDYVRDRIEISPTIPFVYFLDGRVLTLPIANRPPKSGYKKPHWAPCVFNLRKEPRKK